MEKHEAQDFVNECLSLGYGESEIAEELCSRLNAPFDMVMRFVEKVSSSFNTSQTSQDNFSPSNKSRDYQLSVDPYNENGEFNIYIDPPFEEAPIEISPPIKEGNLTKSNGEISSWEYHGQDEGPQLEVDFDELEQSVIRKIKKHFRHSDIVQGVCEITGWNWDQAQRFVAKSQTKHHSELTRSSRNFMIPFSSLFVVGGVLLFIWSALTLFDYYSGWTYQGGSTLPGDLIFLVIAALFSSLGIFAGGLFGLIRTLSK
jgi:hypothetical protein